MLCIPLTTTLVESGQQFFTLLVIGLILLVQIVELYYFLNRSLRELIQFLEHIRNRDFQLYFNEKESRGIRKSLYRTFNEVLEVYREIRIEREVHFRFLEHMIELIEVGIIVFDQKEQVVLCNTAASGLTGIHAMKSWEQMHHRIPDFVARVGTLKESGRILYEARNRASAGIRLAVQVSRTRMLEQTYSLMTIQDVSRVVDQKETGAWLNLLRTLNHEIKNSITPISSLADTVIMILMMEQERYKTLDELSQENLTDLIKSAETLQKRSKSLHGFIDEYHRLTRLPVPDPELFEIESLFGELLSTFHSEMEQAGIRMQMNVKDHGMQIRADRGLTDQMMINLIRNSMDALQDQKEAGIMLTAAPLPDGIEICVSDNGEGIEEDMLEDVFIPFFTTRARGSGIGLSLVRQIMRLHGGHVEIFSQTGSGTRVCLVFPHSPVPRSNKE
jgi:nitrogen fixation/metabolism regulation signal transduction histidine kinase